MRNLKFTIDEDEHLTALENARNILKQSQEERKLGKERLENALKKYKERSIDGPSKRF